MDVTDHKSVHASRSSESIGSRESTDKDATFCAVGSDANMVRSVQLQEEWGILRGEMDKLVAEMASAPAPTQDQVERKEAIAARMSTITKEMSDILARAQEKLPPTPSHPGASEVQEGPPVRSKTGKHRVERTYDSSDSEGPPESRVDQEITLYDINEQDYENLNEKPSVRVGNDRTVLTTIGTKLRSTLQKAHNSLGGKETGITEEEKEALKLEESRLEREIRSLKRNGAADHNTDRMDEITKRLKVIADLTLDSGGSPDEKTKDTTTQESSGGLATKARAFAKTVSGVGKDKDKAKDKEKDAVTGAGDSQARSAGSAAAAASNDSSTNKMPTRKKSMMAKADTTAKKAAQGFSKRWGKFRSEIEKKMAAASAKNKADNAAGSSSSSPNTSPNAMGKQKSDAKSTTSTVSRKKKTSISKAAGSGSPAGVQSTGASNVHDDVNQVKQRLEQRGEKLNDVANETAAMREDASDFLAAARALRKKNEKKGLFT